MKKNIIVKEGEVLEVLPNTTFKVKLDDGRMSICHLSGRMRLNYIKVITGDRVKIEFSPTSLEKGRIVYRY